jgi:adenosine kinase
MAAGAPQVLCVCNPLLDISAEVPLSFLEKYGLKPGNAILAEAKHLPLYEELIANYKVEYIAGGAGQNSARACQWLSQTPGATHYLGCVGKDSYADKMRASVTVDGLTVHYQEEPKEKTGTCAVLVTDKERSLVADLAAANHYSKKHYDTAEVQQVVNQVKVIYVTGFFLTVSPETIMHMAFHAYQHNKVFMLNLSAPFLIDFFYDRMAAVLPFVDVVFGNEHEAAAFGKKHGWGEDLKEVAKKLSGLWKINSARERVVVFTQGAHPTIVYHDGEVHEYPVIKVPKEEIVDTNGAGDSYVGGFLAAYAKGKSLAECVNAASYVASVIIRTAGTSFHGKPTLAI